MIELNFSPGPAALPLVVKQRLAKELLKQQSFFEKSHRRPEVKNLWAETKKRLLEQLGLPTDFFCLLMPGGARLQIAHFWQNYAASYHWGVLLSGYWGRWAYKQGFSYSKTVAPIGLLTDRAAFDGLYYCDNETLSGQRFVLSRAFDSQWLVVDQTSSLMTEPFDENAHYPDLVIAACQKNLGFSGASLVIGHKRVLAELSRNTFGPMSPLDYALQEGMDNDACTPSLMHYWVLSEILNWVEQEGGLSNINKKRVDWANQIYNIIDNSEKFINKVPVSRRSAINITFELQPKYHFLQKKLDTALEQAGCYAFRGHPAYSDGYRLSLYNAVACLDLSPLCQVLVDF